MMVMKKLLIFLLLFTFTILLKCNLVYALNYLPQPVTIGWGGIRNDFWFDLYEQGAIEDFSFVDSCTVRFSSRGLSLANDTLIIYEEIYSLRHCGFFKVFSTSGDCTLIVSKDSSWFEQYKYRDVESILIELIKTNQTYLLDQWNEVPYSTYTTALGHCFVYLFTVKKNTPIQKVWMFDPWFLRLAMRKRYMIKDNIWQPDSTFLMQDDWRFP